MRTPVVGAVTIGQSPRDDIATELLAGLGAEVRLLERGLLDDLDIAGVRAVSPEAEDEVLVSRLRDGTEARLARGWVERHLQRCVKSMEDEVDLILVLCTDPFPGLACGKPLLLPGRLLREFVVSVAARRIGVLTPSAQQVEAQGFRWSDVAPEVVVQAASPYTGASQLEQAGVALAAERVQLVVMDCIGYTQAMGDAVARAAGCPALVAVTTLARTAHDCLNRWAMDNR